MPFSPGVDEENPVQVLPACFLSSLQARAEYVETHSVLELLFLIQKTD